MLLYTVTLYHLIMLYNITLTILQYNVVNIYDITFVLLYYITLYDVTL